MPIMIFIPVANFGDQSLRTCCSNIYTVCGGQFCTVSHPPNHIRGEEVTPPYFFAVCLLSLQNNQDVILTIGLEQLFTTISRVPLSLENLPFYA